MEIVRSTKDISLCQRISTLEIISNAGFLGCKPVRFPMDSHNKLSENSGELIGDATPYRRLISTLLYLTNSRPDIIFPVH